ncbi:MAG: hypothetical protein ACFUZC_17200 [Chthoniobacteraceae bacterium]
MKSVLFPLVAICLLPAMTFAGGKKKTTPKPTPPGRIIIKTISSSEITISTSSASKSYKIDDHTLFTYLGKSVSVTDLRPGMRATVTPAFDGLTASLIAASDAPHIEPK